MPGRRESNRNKYTCLRVYTEIRQRNSFHEHKHLEGSVVWCIISSHVLPAMFACSWCELYFCAFLFARTADLLWSTPVRCGVAGRLWLICWVWAGDKIWLRHRTHCVLLCSTFALRCEFPQKVTFFSPVSWHGQILIFPPRRGTLEEVKSSVFKEQHGSEYSSVPTVR